MTMSIFSRLKIERTEMLQKPTCRLGLVSLMVKMIYGLLFTCEVAILSYMVIFERCNKNKFKQKIQVTKNRRKKWNKKTKVFSHSKKDERKKKRPRKM